MRWFRTGDPTKVRRKIQKGSEIERFWGFVEKTETCWLWTGSIDTKGYGQWTRPDKSKVGAHRLAYQLAVGPIPDGLDLDHVKERGCTRRDCVNPSHLEPVTRKINIQRGANRNREKTHCKRDHEFTPENTYKVGVNGRGCRACRTAYFKIRDANRGSRK